MRVAYNLLVDESTRSSLPGFECGADLVHTRGQAPGLLQRGRYGHDVLRDLAHEPLGKVAPAWVADQDPRASPGAVAQHRGHPLGDAQAVEDVAGQQIGRASCRERG